MQDLIQYFANIPPPHRTLIIALGLTLFWQLERIIPMFHFSYKKWKHAWPNLFFTLTTVLVNFSFAFILVKTSDWVTSHSFGILYLIDIPIVVFMIVGILLMDFIGAYLIHYIEHKTPWMWRFHLVHHTDQHLDTSSANRHHPGESVFRFIFTTLAVFVIGAPMWMVFMYQSLSVMATQFSHANIQLPTWLDRMLVLFICTPSMHRVHHHYKMPQTDSNFGNIFSIWDRLFNTFQKMDAKDLVFGLDTHMSQSESDDLKTLLKIPFRTNQKK